MNKYNNEYHFVDGNVVFLVLDSVEVDSEATSSLKAHISVAALTLDNIPYPAAIQPLRLADGRLCYDRKFLLQFEPLCKGKPAHLAPFRIDALGIAIKPEPTSLQLEYMRLRNHSR
ncbi:hypothetical protein MKEN_01426700 [Mycena kentingensis (nom. inval.)]|nr:hypothetical protein MKEN_01426700 [Mycena kentingensis (nom. inval.)]